MAQSNNADKAKELFERANEGIKQVIESDRFKDYLKTMAKFHTYSARNSLLILVERPDATLVAGYQSWIKNFTAMSKRVKRGFLSLHILHILVLRKREHLTVQAKK